MSTNSKVDSSTLGWVKSEIDETLKQARIALESFAENPADKTRLRYCVTHLHQVVGTLLMVELDSAGMLARELEALAESLLREDTKTNDAALEALTRGIVVLPDYLSRLQFGQPDTPLRYRSMLNDLRAARGEAPISEAELFAPDLSVRPPAPGAGQTKLSDLDYAALAKQIRTGFQSALLEWLRDNGNQQALDRIADSMQQLQVQASIGAIEQMFWVAGAFVEALREGGLDPGGERKKIFARLDQQIKKVIDGAEKPQLRSSSEALTKALLYEVGNATSPGPKVAQVTQAFALESVLNAGLSPAEQVEVSDMPSPAVLQSVSAALAREIEAAQDVLTTYFDPEQTDTTSLEPLRGLLHKMSGTLDMLDVPRLKSLVDELSAVTAALMENRIERSEAVSMSMAQALIMVETSARDIHGSAKEWKSQIENAIVRLHALHSGEAGDQPATDGIEVGEAALTEVEFRELVSVVAKEVTVSLSKVEESLEAFAADMTKVELLADAPPLLTQIQGALQILGVERVSELAERSVQHVHDIQAGRLVPTSRVLDGLAVCVGTIGAYIDGLRAGRHNLDALVDSATREMDAVITGSQRAAPSAEAEGDLATYVAKIRSGFEDWLQRNYDPVTLEEIQRDLETVARLAGVRGQDKLERISAEMGNLLQLVKEEPEALSDDIANTLRQSFETMSALAIQDAGADSQLPAADEEIVLDFEGLGADEITLAPPPTSGLAPPLVNDDFDEDIIEIFIEDAREVMQNVTREFAVWRENPDDKNSLAELRRGYHTIKGSGRMVGAAEVAELGWAFENLLNRIRDGKVKPDAEIVDALDQAQTLVPALVDHLAGGPRPDTDVEALRLRAHALADPAHSGAPRSVSHATGAAFVARDGQMLPTLDATLLEIFTNEAQAHLTAIAQEIEDCRQSGGGRLVTPALFRSIHTLQGNAGSLGIRMMLESCAEVEKLLHELKALESPLDENQLDLLSEFQETVSELVVLLNNGATSAGDLPGKFANLARRFHEHSARLLQGRRDENVSEEEADIDLGEEILGVNPETSPGSAFPAPPAETLDAGFAADGTADEEVDPELLEIFHEEATDILATVDEALARWRANERDLGAVQDLKRALHTLKGGARMAGVKTMGELSHNTESLLKHIEDTKLVPSPDLFDLLEEAHDNMVSMVGRLQKGQPAPLNKALNAKLLQLLTGKAAVPPTAARKLNRESDGGMVSGRHATPASPVAGIGDGVEDAAPDEDETSVERRDTPDGEPEGWSMSRDRRGQIRVNTELLNNLVNFAGEVSISRSRMEQQIYGFRDNLAELSRNSQRFRDQIRELEIQSESQILYRLEKEQQVSGADSDFDPLEFDRFSKLQQLSRSLTESLHDLSTIQLSLGNFVGEAESVLQQQARINTDLQEGLMRTRMIKFSTQAPRLRHILRQTARELGKRAELQLGGSEVEIDRTVMERMIGPFEHMIRNALDHGIETEHERRRAGKPPFGRITINTAQEGSEIIIRFSDDGAGLNIEAIRRKAVESKLVASDAILDEDELIQFILMAGFSTAGKVTHVSGRGVGMDVVHNEVKQLGGSMGVETKRGIGTTFSIRLPLTLSITQALMIHVGDQLFALPLSSVSNIIEYPVDQLNNLAVGKNPLLNYNDHVYQYLNLAARLGVPAQVRNGRKVPVLLARSGNREVAVQIDGLAGTREIVIKSVGAQLAEIKGIAGATILGDGRVILILDMAGLWLTDDIIRVEHRGERVEKARLEVRERPVVMVVDDSLTVRKVTSKHLQKRGVDVMVAKDGIDATEQLRERVPDVMLVDIEMPRMDGYELTNRVRSDPQLKHIPIIMITSRAGSKHRQRAFDLGVDMYMSKPYQEDDLFKNIDTLLVRGRTSAK